FGCVWVFRAIRVLRDGPTRGHSPGLQTRHEAHGHSLTLMIASWYCNLRSRSQHGRKMRYLASAYRLFKGLFRYVARRFLDLTIAVYIKVKENTLKVIAGAITAMLVAGTTLAWEPIKLKLIDPGLEWVTERLWPVEILDQRTAIQLARTLVGSSALEVIPFRNDRDPNHYVLVWTKGRDCGTENGQSCPHGTGAVYAELLAGSQGQYQR